MEHHANLVPWQLLVQEIDGDLEFIPITDDGILRLDVFEVLLRLKPKLVAFTHVSNTLGTINPVREMVEMAHAAGALVLVDGAQAVPHVPVDVQALGADFYAFCGHKMLAPMGSGALWARRELLEAMPPFLSGGEMIREVHLRRTDFNEIPWKFEAGTPAVGDAIGLGVAAEYLTAIGMDAVREHERDLVAYALETLPREVPDIELYGPMDPDLRGGVVPFNLPGIHPHDVAQVLDRFGIAVRAGHHCTMPLHERLDLAATARASVQRLHDPRRHRRARRRPRRGPARLQRLSAGPTAAQRPHRAPRRPRSPVASRPSIAPAMSASERFWLSFHLPSTRSITSSTPTIAFSWPSMYGSRRVVDRPRARSRAASWRSLRAPDVDLDPGRVVVDDEPAVDVGGDVVPGRDHAAVLGFVAYQAGEMYAFGPADDGHRLADRAAPSTAGCCARRARAATPHGRPGRPPARSRASGSIVASSPSAVEVIRSAAPRFRRSSRTSSSSGLKWAGTYIVEASHDDRRRADRRSRVSPGRATRQVSSAHCQSAGSSKTMRIAAPEPDDRREPFDDPDLHTGTRIGSSAGHDRRSDPPDGPGRPGRGRLANWSRNASALIVPVVDRGERDASAGSAAPPLLVGPALGERAGDVSRTQPSWLIRTGRRR